MSKWYFNGLQTWNLKWSQHGGKAVKYLFYCTRGTGEEVMWECSISEPLTIRKTSMWKKVFSKIPDTWKDPGSVRHSEVCEDGCSTKRKAISGNVWNTKEGRKAALVSATCIVVLMGSGFPGINCTGFTKGTFTTSTRTCPEPADKVFQRYCFQNV